MTITYSLRVYHWFHMGVYLSCLGLMKTKGLQGALKDDLPLSEKTKLASWLSRLNPKVFKKHVFKKKNQTTYFRQGSFLCSVWSFVTVSVQIIRVWSILLANKVQSISIKGKENMIDCILGKRNLKSTLSDGQPSMTIQGCVLMVSKIWGSFWHYRQRSAKQ